MIKILILTISLFYATILYAETVTFTWLKNIEPNIIKYNLYCSKVNSLPYKFVSSTTTNIITTILPTNLSTHYCYITAINDYNLESKNSNIVRINKK